jgi:hypothetical protein
VPYPLRFSRVAILLIVIWSPLPFRSRAATSLDGAVHRTYASFPRPHIDYSWDPLKVGNCHQVGATLTFWLDGQARFNATISTDHTWFGDIWHSGFVVQDDFGHILYEGPQGAISSQKTHGAPVSMEGYFNYPQTLYPSLPKNPAMIQQRSSC